MSTTNRNTEPPLTLAPGRWTLDADRSHAEFRVKHTWGLATVKGQFKGKSGSLTISETQQWSMELVLDAASLDTGHKKRDEDLRSPNFFDVENHPTVRFSSTAVTFAGGQLHVAGKLEAGPQSIQITPETTIRVNGDDIELEATAIVDQRTLGMTRSPLGMVKTPSVLHVHAFLLPVL